MKKTFTRFLAALALLAILALPMGMMGQSTVTFDATTDITANASSYQTTELTINAADGSTWKANGYGATAYTSIVIGKGGANYLETPEVSGNIVSVTVTWSGNASYYLALQTTSGTELEAKNNTSAGATETFNVSGTYSQLRLVGRRSSGTSNAAATITKVIVTYSTGGTTPVETVATPTFSVTAGTYTSAQTVSISCETSGATIYYTTDGTAPTTSSNVYSAALTISETTTVKAMAVKSGMNNSAVATAEYIINLPYSGPDYVRVTDITALTDGTRVIIAARYNSTATSYYAMTAATTGKPTGVSFSSTTSSNGEILPSTILDNENTYYWTVNVTSNGYTFTNANNKVLGYTSSTNFAEGGNNTEWAITRNTSGSSAMVSGYEGFYITNKNNSGRGIALNDQHNYGPYATSNNNSSTYNFYLDIFVQGYVPAAVATPTFTPAEGTYYDAQNVTINCETQNADIYYTTDGSTPDGNSTPYTGPISVTATTTINAIAYYGGANSNVATATYTIVPPLSTMDEIFAAATSAGNTATTVHIALGNWVVTGANSSSHAFVSDGTKGFMIYASGHGFSTGDVLSGTVECKVQRYNGAAEITQLTSSTTGLTVTTGGTVTVANIAMANLAGINTGALVSYQNLTCEAKVEGNYTNYYLSDGTTTIQAYKTLFDDYADYLENGKTYNITGVFVLNNSTKRINPRSSADIEEVVVPHVEYTLTVSDLSHVDLIVFDADDTTTPIISGEGSAQVYDGTSVMISVDVEEGYVIESLIVDDEDVTSQIDAANTYTFTMPTHAVTVTASAEVLTGDQYELYSGALVEGDYLIVYGGKAMNNTTTSNRLQYEEVVAINDVITTDNAEIVWHIAQSGAYWTIFSADANAYAASTGTKSQATTMADGTDDKALWTISGTETYEFVNKYNADNSVNSNLRENTTYGFACYATTTGGALSLYKKVETPTPQTFTLDIDQYTSGQNNGWYLIASPVSVDIESNTMISGTYDLYRFNPTATGAEWENYKNTEHSDFTTLEVGRGYLYANGNNGGIQLSFTGTPADNGEVTTAYNGWNLIGNPLSTAAIVDKDYYRMNDTRTGIMTTSSSDNVAKMEGIFVQAEEGETVTFTAASKGERSNSTESVVLNIMQDGKVIDRAIVRFNSDRQMLKFQLFQGSTKIYFPMEDADYAIVSSNGQGNMPVNFKAARTGEYTLSVETEGIDMNYMHIIDRLTGEDINVLLDNEYSFIASQSDVADRFILSFNENGYNAESNETFAFQNGSDIIVNGNGTLQVFDVTGRMVMNTTVNGVQTVNMPNGVYVFRMIGETVNTQKIVVR